MTAKEKAREKANAKALKNLFSPDDEVVVGAIHELKESGDHNIIHPLLEVMLSGSERVNAEVEQVLFQLKDTKAMEQLVQALDNPKYESLRVTIIASFWNTGQWPMEHITKLCEIAVNGSYEEAFEVLTVIEHMEDELQPAEAEEALEPIREYLMLKEGHENYAIIESLHVALNKFGDV